MQTDGSEIDIKELLERIRSEARRRRVKSGDDESAELSPIDRIDAVTTDTAMPPVQTEEDAYPRRHLFSNFNSWIQQRRLTTQVFATCMDELVQAMRKIADHFDTAGRRTDDLACRIARIEQYLVRERMLPVSERGNQPPIHLIKRQQLGVFYQALLNSRRDMEARNAERISRYLDMIKALDSAIQRAPMLDVDCGCGVWLQALMRMGYDASGTEQDEALFSYCKNLGLPVTRAHPLSRLQALEASTHGFISAFRLVDHLALPTAFCAIVEIHRLLRPGGLAIFHSPSDLPERWLHDEAAPAVIDSCMDPMQILSFLLLHVGFTVDSIQTEMDKTLHTAPGLSAYPRAIAARKPMHALP